MLFRHELGHVFDYVHMDAAMRDTFLRIIGESGRAWRDPTEPNSPHERFAEGYALCSAARSKVEYEAPARRAYAYTYPWPTHRRVCRLIRSAFVQSA